MNFMDEKRTTRWFWQKSQEKHEKRLKEIQKKNGNRVDNVLAKQRIGKTRVSSFLKNERKKQIVVDNRKLLNILVDVSRGRRETSTAKILGSALSLPRKDSLNLSIRKEEEKRIQSDNEAIAKRLMRTTQGLSFKQLDKEWKVRERYRKTISRSQFRTPLGQKTANSIKTKSLAQDTKTDRSSSIEFQSFLTVTGKNLKNRRLTLDPISKNKKHTS